MDCNLKEQILIFNLCPWFTDSPGDSTDKVAIVVACVMFVVLSFLLTVGVIYVYKSKCYKAKYTPAESRWFSHWEKLRSRESRSLFKLISFFIFFLRILHDIAVNFHKKLWKKSRLKNHNIINIWCAGFFSVKSISDAISKWFTSKKNPFAKEARVWCVVANIDTFRYLIHTEAMIMGDTYLYEHKSISFALVGGGVFLFVHCQYVESAKLVLLKMKLTTWKSIQSF